MDPCVHAPTRLSSSSTGVDLVNRVRWLGRGVSFADQSRERDLESGWSVLTSYCLLFRFSLFTTSLRKSRRFLTRRMQRLE